MFLYFVPESFRTSVSPYMIYIPNWYYIIYGDWQFKIVLKIVSIDYNIVVVKSTAWSKSGWIAFRFKNERRKIFSENPICFTKSYRLSFGAPQASAYTHHPWKTQIIITVVPSRVSCRCTLSGIRSRSGIIQYTNIHCGKYTLVGPEILSSVTTWSSKNI